MITKEMVRDLFFYNEITGELTFVDESGKGKRKDRKVGSVTPRGYLVVFVDNTLCQAHRIIWLHYYGILPEFGIDHINGNTTDNSISNLRDVRQGENTKNRSMAKNNTSGFNGVFWDKVLGKWRARISVNKKPKYLGCFEEKSDAIQARKEANKKYGYHENHGRILK